MDPRWLPASDAARHVGMDTEAFRRAVRRGTFPPASYAIGKQSPRWDRLALDRTMDPREAVSDIGEAIRNVGQAIREEAKAKASPQETGRRHNSDLQL
jgi:hypothetical protein